MIKRLFLLVFVLFLGLWLYPGTISLQKAQEVAVNFWNSRVTSVNPGNPATPSIVVSAQTHLYNEVVVYYQFDMMPEGWILVSADDAAYPVLAYSPTGRFEAENMPVNTAAWLNQYEKKLEEITLTRMEATPEIAQAWGELLKTPDDNQDFLKKTRGVAPFLTTTWNQGRYYNDMCPADPSGPGGHCYAGCVPTAMGQICNYFRWPESGLGTYSYYDSTYGMLSADFGNTYYRWDEMAVALNQTNLAVAELLYHLGVSCDLVYGPDGSGMYNHKAAYALRTFFKYDPATEYVYRDSTNMNWDSLLITHLDRRIPLYYAGWSVPNINGHAFVCDGYQEDHFYHFNWGWGGSNDGYFYTNALNPGGSNFNLAQELIINAVPDSVNYTYPQGCAGSSVLVTTNGTIDDGSGPLYAYEPGVSCSWLIAPSDSVSSISLDFLAFDLAADDTVFIFNGNSAEAPLIAAFSGQMLPDPLLVENDEVFIAFVSSGNTGSDGWLLSFVAEIPVYCRANEMLTDATATFDDGSGPRDYHNVTSCMWMIAPPDAEVIELEFSHFDTEPLNDVVIIYDGNDVIGEFSGNELPPVLKAYSGYMFVVFSTNFDITASGWTATYTSNLVGEQVPEAPVGRVSIFPNPVNQTLNIVHDAGLGESQITLTNSTGKLLVSTTTLNGKAELDLTDTPSGLYLLHAKNADFSEVTKVVVR